MLHCLMGLTTRMTTLLYILLGVSLAYLLLSSWLKQRFSGFPALSARDAETLMREQGAVLLDVRPDADFARGHVPAAVHIPLEALKDRFGEMGADRSRPVIVCCNSGERSLEACLILHRRDYRRVVNLRGGVRAWAKAGLPLEQD